MNDQISRYQDAVSAGQRPRAAFLAKTYNHLLGAILGFVALEIVLFKTGIAASIFQLVASSGNMGWLLIMGGFMVVSYMFTNLAQSRSSKGVQYAGLAGYTAAWAVMFAAPLYLAWTLMSPEIVKNAALITIVSFGALTAIVYYTGKDFTFLRSGIMWGSFLALGLIVLSAVFGFQLGNLFMIGMVGLSGASILYSTSAVLQDYPDDFHVAAALALMASVMMLFWYVLQLVMSFAGSD